MFIASSLANCFSICPSGKYTAQISIQPGLNGEENERANRNKINEC